VHLRQRAAQGVQDGALRGVQQVQVLPDGGQRQQLLRGDLLGRPVQRREHRLRHLTGGQWHHGHFVPVAAVLPGESSEAA